VLQDEAVVRQQALDAARESLRLTQNQYKAGLIAYMDVVVQATALNNERSNLSLLQSRLIASVQLIAALGGGWDGQLRAARSRWAMRACARFERQCRKSLGDPVLKPSDCRHFVSAFSIGISTIAGFALPRMNSITEGVGEKSHAYR
jgi:hypothetical protein